MDGITPETINSFKEFCATDDTKAMQFLTHCDGNLETAVQLFFQTGGTLQNTSEGINNVDNEIRELRRRNVASNGQQISRHIQFERANRPIGWMDWLVAIVALPLRFTLTTLWDLFSFFTDMILGARRPAVTDPRGDVARFRSYYTENYAANAQYFVSFFSGSYNEALREAKSSLKMLVVFLHNPSNNDSDRFIRESLNSQEFSELVARNDLIVWGVSTSSAEGANVAMYFRPRVYPFVGLICLRNNKMGTSLRLEGFMDATGLTTNLQLTIEDYNAQLTILRMQKRQREEDQRLMIEQEREYKESAARDRARIQERRRLESEKQEALEKELKKQRQIEQRKEVIAAHRESLRAVPVFEHTGADAVRVQVRFPSGQRFERRFEPDDSLESLFVAIMCQETCPDFFTVHTSFPRKEIFCAPQWYHSLLLEQLTSDGSINSYTNFQPALSFREAGLEKSVGVFVQDCEA